ncbi:MAG: 50S ribosomal protein L21 [Gemmatimonadetes bacterium]|nr:50S ribosomal protein L21 [Gemmatimonadota bacterium]
MYAIFRAQGKQFRAVQDAVIRIPSLEAEPGDQVEFDDVLLAESDGDVHVGAPSLKGASVAAEVIAHGRGEKIIVYKMKRRKGYRRKQGHRQGYTDIRIVDITMPSGKPKRPDVKSPQPKAKYKPVSETAQPTLEAAPEKPAKKKAPVKAAESEPVEAVEAPATKPPAADAAPAPESEPAAQADAEPSSEPAAEAEAESAPEPEASAEINITDAARELAEAHGLDLASIEGTGKDGRILKGDVDKAIKAKDGD